MTDAEKCTPTGDLNFELDTPVSSAEPTCSRLFSRPRCGEVFSASFSASWSKAVVLVMVGSTG
jgi:hypothetical protein